MKGLSEESKRSLSRYFLKIIDKKIKEGAPLSLHYVFRKMTSVDWNILDLFYRLCGFDVFKNRFDLAQEGEDEGPICNLSLISQYLGRFTEEYLAIITANILDKKLANIFFGSYLFALFRRGESEYEDANDPFPKGRIPFLTIHQSKGLEFPVVILGNPRTGHHDVQAPEKFVRPFLHRESEPLEKVKEFDKMRMYYVALSRAEELLVIANYKAQGHFIDEPFKTILATEIPNIGKIPTVDVFDVSTLPPRTYKEGNVPKSYSYTGDYISYTNCARQYMIFRKYEFVPSRAQTMFFGSVVHQTVEDLHERLIALRSQGGQS